MGKFIISKRTNGDFQFNLKAANGQVVMTSQGYSSRSGCEKGIEAVKNNSERDEAFDRKRSVDKKWYFNMKAANGEIIGTSEIYESHSAMENGIVSVRVNAPKAVVIDE